MPDESIEAVQPLVDGVLALLGVPFGPMGIGLGLGMLRRQSIEKFATKAAARIASRRGTEDLGLTEFDREAVETRVAELLKTGSREALLPSAILGRDDFADALVLDRKAAFDGLASLFHEAA